MIVDVADAALARLQTMDVPAYDSDGIPQQPDMPYAVMYVDLGRPDAYRLSARSKLTGWRIAVITVGSGAYEARYAADQVSAAYTGHRFVIPGYSCTPCQAESSTPVEIDNFDIPGIYSSTGVWTFSSTPAV